MIFYCSNKAKKKVGNTADSQQHHANVSVSPPGHAPSPTLQGSNDILLNPNIDCTSLQPRSDMHRTALMSHFKDVNVVRGISGYQVCYKKGKYDRHAMVLYDSDHAYKNMCNQLLCAFLTIVSTKVLNMFFSTHCFFQKQNI